MIAFETEFGHAFNEDCRDTLSRFPDNFFDLVITSPPYNIGIPYDTHNDNMPFDEYWVFIRDVFDKIFLMPCMKQTSKRMVEGFSLHPICGPSCNPSDINGQGWWI
jgi:DNA modification methylase